MDWDILLKVVPLFGVGGILGAGKLLYDLAIGKRGRMREEYKFAYEFLSALGSNQSMHPYVREKGYQAIAGDSTLDADVIEYLLSLKNGDRALKDYVLGRHFLEHLPAAGNLQIKFKSKYNTSWSRRWRITLYAISYAGFGFAAFAPFFLAAFFPQAGTKILSATFITFPFFAPYAWLSLTAGTRIFRAQKLVKHQQRHTQRIVIDAGF